MPILPGLWLQVSLLPPSAGEAEKSPLLASSGPQAGPVDVGGPLLCSQALLLHSATNSESVKMTIATFILRCKHMCICIFVLFIPHALKIQFFKSGSMIFFKCKLPARNVLVSKGIIW